MSKGIVGKFGEDGLPLAHYCSFDQIRLELKSKTKEDVLYELAELLAESPNIDSIECAYNAMLDREKLASTGMGLGVAIPHGRSPNCRGVSIAFGRSTRGIDFDALDGEPVHIFFAILVPSSALNLHLEILASLSIKLRDEESRRRIMEAKFPQEILDFLGGQ